MDFGKVIRKRKSIRSFEEKPVPKKILIEIIKDGIKAPSSENDQPWEFYVITSKKLRDKIASIMAKSLTIYKRDFDALPTKVKKEALEFYKNLGNCQNIIFVYTGKAKKYQMESKIMGISAAIENIMLSAVNNNLGTCWVGGFRGFKKEIRKITKVRADKKLIAGILIGYLKKGYKPLTREKKRLRDILHFV